MGYCNFLVSCILPNVSRRRCRTCSHQNVIEAKVIIGKKLFFFWTDTCKTTLTWQQCCSPKCVSSHSECHANNASTRERFGWESLPAVLAGLTTLHMFPSQNFTYNFKIISFLFNASFNEIASLMIWVMWPGLIITQHFYFFIQKCGGWTKQYIILIIFFFPKA